MNGDKDKNKYFFKLRKSKDTFLSNPSKQILISNYSLSLEYWLPLEILIPYFYFILQLFQWSRGNFSVRGSVVKLVIMKIKTTSKKKWQFRFNKQSETTRCLSSVEDPTFQHVFFSFLFSTVNRTAFSVNQCIQTLER